MTKTHNNNITMKRYLYILLTAAAMVYSMRMSAQAYFCDFEDSKECAQWHRNHLVRQAVLENKWYIGAAGQFGLEGSQGMYISSDADSARATYVATKQMFVLSYRDMTLNAGMHTILFDYQVAGGTGARFSLWWLPQSVAISSANNMMAPDWTQQGGVRIGNPMYNAPTWRSAAYTFQVSNVNAQGRLVVVWESQQGTPNPPSACIDNIAIFEGDLCATSPTNVTYTKGKVTWQANANASQYVVCAYNTYSGTYTPYDTLTTNSWTPTITNEGYYIIYVRTLCTNGSYSPWTTTGAFVYIPGARCLDYMDLDAATCYYGPFDNVTGAGTTVGKIDRGYSSVESHHTIHYLSSERDPRTLNQLKTVPDGEIASVRLGNWNADNSISSQGAAEAIEYKYTVTAGASDIMVLKYAVVMEKPGHNDGTDPHFTLEILDGNRQITPEGCFKADFAASSDRPQDLVGWVEIPEGQLQGVEGAGWSPIIWKNWDTISVSLRNYVGKTLTIRFTTKDCRQSAHWAYAYLTIGCRNGSLEGIACGDFSTDHFTAPDGFNYEWYKESEPSNILSRDQELHISNQDTNIYVVDVISRTSSGCYYSLTANPNPRYAHAELEVASINHDHCSNKVVFDNLANVSYINRMTKVETISDEPLEAVYWDFGDGTPEVESREKTMVHAFPAEGGTFRVQQVASMSNGVCQDTTVYELILPNVSEMERVDSVVRACSEVGFNLPNNAGKVYTDTVYQWFTTNEYGCFMQNQVDVRFFDRIEDTTRYIMCEGEVYAFEGMECSKSGFYTKRYDSQYGCDSVRVLDLTVVDRLLMEVPDTIYVCADDKFVDIPFEVQKGTLSGEDALVRFDKYGVLAGFEENYSCSPNDGLLIPIVNTLRAGYYPMDITFSSECAPYASTHVVVAVQYANTIMESMEGLLALYNSKYNGGYNWTSYQWYCNGERMEGATRSYLTLTSEDIGKSYYCVLTREDGVVIASCPIVYDAGMGVEDVEEDAEYKWYDLLGRPVAEPTQSGLYIRVKVSGRNTQTVLLR